jgi:cytochrome b subunit of formate dehydrogenase
MRGTLTVAACALVLLHSGTAFAIDSYRYLHVSIETPWLIFLFLLVAIFIPFILMLILMWRRPLQNSTATPKPKTPDDE